MNNYQVRRTLTLSAAVLVTVGGLAFAAREPLYEAMAGASSGEPGLRGPLALIAGKGLLVLVAITAAIAVVAWRRGREPFLLLVAAGTATVTAYLTSETVKLLVTEERPCRRVAVDTIMACPGAGDWSWPSNHATIAAALAASCILLVPRIWRLVVPVALAIALSRVLVGVHYPHDVTAGLALGIMLVLLVTPVAFQLLVRALGEREPDAVPVRASNPRPREVAHPFGVDPSAAPVFPAAGRSGLRS